MKKVLLSVFAALVASASFAQPFMDGAVTISGAVTDGEGDVTITVFPSVACNNGTALTTAAALHSSVAGGTPFDWIGANTVEWDKDGIVRSATPNPDGSFSITINPRTYYSVAAGTRIEGLAFIFNQGSVIGQTDQWAASGRAFSAAGATDCGNFLIPFPVPSQLVATKGKQIVSNISKQNAPNPFRSSTSISFSVASAKSVTVKIYDLLGSEVATLLDKKVPAGTTTVTWDGNSNGKRASAGVYFYTVKAGDEIDTKKMMLID